MSALLALNAGSSSLKFALYADDAALTLWGRGEVSGIGRDALWQAQRAGAAAERRELGRIDDAARALDVAFDWIGTHFHAIEISAIGHRIVHGGTRYTAPAVLDESVLNELEALDPLAPQHQPYNLAGARDMMRRFPRALAVACFDTAFHAGWDDAAARLALPRRFHDAGVRRYGFHGLSYEFLSGRLRELVPLARRAVIAHLGSGASICAVRDGRSIDCSMGFSVLDGLPMATRSGAIDPGAIFHLHRGYGLGFDEIEHLLYYDSGLKGMSGIGGDMRELLADGRVDAGQAIAVFVRHCVGAIGAMAAQLGGLDALVFSGGIGARADRVRAGICAQLEFLGVKLDTERNAANAERISAPTARVPVFALATDEEIVIARHCRNARNRAHEGKSRT